MGSPSPSASRTSSAARSRAPACLAKAPRFRYGCRGFDRARDALPGASHVKLEVYADAGAAARAVAPVLPAPHQGRRRRGEGGADPDARSLPVQDAFAVPFVQAERRSVAILAHAFITFSASPHCHCAAVSMEPPPMRWSTPAARSSPLVESVSLNSACAPPTNG